MELSGELEIDASRGAGFNSIATAWTMMSGRGIALPWLAIWKVEQRLRFGLLTGTVHMDAHAGSLGSVTRSYIGGHDRVN
jgi:hypothetical protein